MLKRSALNFKTLLLFLFCANILFACSKSAEREGQRENKLVVTPTDDTLQVIPNDKVQSPPLLIGWQTAWSPSGEIAQTLIHTDIAKKENLNLQFVGFLFGPDMNEAAINHDINCLNTGNVPAISLLAKSSDWTIIARLIRQPLSIIARNGSGIKNIEDLKGKTLGIPYGSGPHPYLLSLLKSHGLWDGKSELPLNIMNIAPSEQIMALQQKSVDAIATWEPQSTIAIQKKLGILIDQEITPGFIIVEKKFAQNNPETIVNLLRAYLQAEYFVSTHKELTDTWFAEASHFGKDLISKIQIVEPNILQKDPKKIDLNLNEEEIAKTQEYADELLAAGLIKNPVSIKENIDLSFLQKAQTQWQKKVRDADHDLKAVEINQN